MNKSIQGALMIFASALTALATIQVIPLAAFSREGARLGVAIAFANALLCFASLSWTFLKSDKFFFSAFYGGMMWKLAALGATVYFLVQAGYSAIVPALLALASMTVILNVVELFYLPANPIWISKKY